MHDALEFEFQEDLPKARIEILQGLLRLSQFLFAGVPRIRSEENTSVVHMWYLSVFCADEQKPNVETILRDIQMAILNTRLQYHSLRHS